MKVSTHFGDVVVILVAPVDRSARFRNGVLVVESVDEALPRPEIEPVLSLTDGLRGLVNDGLERPEEESVPGITRIQKRLSEQAAGSAAKLICAEPPVTHLCGAQPGWLDGVSGDRLAVGGGELTSQGWTEVNAGF